MAGAVPVSAEMWMLPKSVYASELAFCQIANGMALPALLRAEDPSCCGRHGNGATASRKQAHARDDGYYCTKTLVMPGQGPRPRELHWIQSAQCWGGGAQNWRGAFRKPQAMSPCRRGHLEVGQLAGRVVAGDVAAHGVHPRLVDRRPHLGPLACGSAVVRAPSAQLSLRAEELRGAQRRHKPLIVERHSRMSFCTRY